MITLRLFEIGLQLKTFDSLPVSSHDAAWIEDGIGSEQRQSIGYSLKHSTFLARLPLWFFSGFFVFHATVVQLCQRFRPPPVNSPITRGCRTNRRNCIKIWNFFYDNDLRVASDVNVTHEWNLKTPDKTCTVCVSAMVLVCVRDGNSISPSSYLVFTHSHIELRFLIDKPIVQLRLGTGCERTNSRHFLPANAGSFDGMTIGWHSSRVAEHPSVPHSMSTVSP